MKKYLTFTMVLVLAVALILPFSVSAKTKAGTKPGNFFYFFDKTFEKVDLFFTFNPEKKAKKALGNADERLAEAEELANENDQKAVETAMKDYQENISLAETEAKEIKDEIKTKELLSTIASSTSKHQEVLEKILTKVPEQTKEAIQKAIEASKKKEEKSDEKTTEPKKEVSEIKQEIKKTNDEPEKNKDEQKKEIDKLKKEVETLKQKQPQVKIIEKIIEKEKLVIIENKQSSSSQTKQNENIVTLPNGAVVEMDASGNVVRTIKEAPNIGIQNNHTIPSTQNSSQFFVRKTLNIVPRDYSSDLLLHDAKTNLRLISVRFLASGDTETIINGVPTQLAHSATDTHINNIHIKLNGSASMSVIKKLRVLSGNDATVSGDYTFDNNGEVVFSTSITVPSGESRDYIIAADVADNNSLEQGKSISLSVVSIDSDAEIATSLPITGYSYKIASSQISIQSQVCNLTTTNLKTDYLLDNLLQNSNNDGRIFMNAYILNSSGGNYYNSNPSAVMTITTSNHSNDKTISGSGSTGQCGYYYPYEFYTTERGTYTITYSTLGLSKSVTITVR